MSGQMLRFNFEGGEWFDEQSNTFLYTSKCTVLLEHSLLSVSKWESKWKQSFLSTVGVETFSTPMLMDYIAMMEVGDCGEPNWMRNLTPTQIRRIVDYIGEEQTATTFQNYGPDRRFSREVITSEMIYYWMASLNIPFTCESWHLSRLLTLIHVASIKGRLGKKMPARDVRQMYAELNEKRKRQYKTKG